MSLRDRKEAPTIGTMIEDEFEQLMVLGMLGLEDTINIDNISIIRTYRKQFVSQFIESKNLKIKPYTGPYICIDVKKWSTDLINKLRENEYYMTWQTFDHVYSDAHARIKFRYPEELV